MHAIKNCKSCEIGSACDFFLAFDIESFVRDKRAISISKKYEKNRSIFSASLICITFFFFIEKKKKLTIY